MPKIHGSEMAKKIRDDEEIKNIPIIFMTSLLEKMPKDGGTGSLGGNPMLAKPVLMKELLPVIKHLIKEEDA